jgi:hypothetical protein
MKVTSAGNKVILEFLDKTKMYRLERKYGNDGDWLVWANHNFVPDTGGIVPSPVSNLFVDTSVSNGIYQYRARIYADSEQPFDYSMWVRCGDTGPMGYTFGNYHAPEGQWGVIQTPDDLRYTWLWGVDFKASNGDSFSDEQIEFFINDAMRRIERELNITLKKTRVVCEPQQRELKPGIDYDADESYYTFKRERVQRNGMIHTRKRPVQSVSRLDLLSRNNRLTSLLNAYTLDKTKGRITFFNRPPRVSDSLRAVDTAIFPYGADTFERNLLYAIDYVAGYPTSDDVPDDLRAIVGKLAAICLLNNIGRGLMSGFSSSSLSMDGVSESFSSTQSATSAYYGADIKQYETEVQDYISANKLKFGHLALGSL